MKRTSRATWRIGTILAMGIAAVGAAMAVELTVSQLNEMTDEQKHKETFALTFQIQEKERAMRRISDKARAEDPGIQELKGELSKASVSLRELNVQLAGKLKEQDALYLRHAEYQAVRTLPVAIATVKAENPKLAQLQAQIETKEQAVLECDAAIQASQKAIPERLRSDPECKALAEAIATLRSEAAAIPGRLKQADEERWREMMIRNANQMKSSSKFETR